MKTSVSSPGRFATAKVGAGCILDSRRALYHPMENWLAVADIHFGYELNRARKHGALLPQWGMAATQARLLGLLNHYKPRTLILDGDVMDGGGSVRETTRLLKRLRDCVAVLVCVEGNHDRPALRKDSAFVAMHREPGFIFQHGHKYERTLEGESAEGCVVISGHEHPTLNLSDGAGLKLKLPALVQQRRKAAMGSHENWILPAFSPWAGGAPYDQGYEILETWGCSEEHVIRGSMLNAPG